MVTTEARITNIMQEMEDRISRVEDTLEKMGSLVKGNIKSKKFLT